MKALGKVLGLIFLGLLLLVVALGFALTQLFDPNDYKDEIRQLARDKANLELSINGDIGCGLGGHVVHHNGLQMLVCCIQLGRPFLLRPCVLLLPGLIQRGNIAGFASCFLCGNAGGFGFLFGFGLGCLGFAQQLLMMRAQGFQLLLHRSYIRRTFATATSTRLFASLFA